MQRRLFLAVTFFAVAGGSRAANAEPITYKISGYFNTFIQGGATVPFNAVFTVNSEGLSPAANGALTAQIPLTMNIGGQSFGPTTEVVLQQGVWNGQPWVDASFGSKGLPVGIMGFDIGFVELNATLGQSANLSSFNFSQARVNDLNVLYAYGPGGLPGYEDGVVTSFEAVPAPEPSTLVIFVAIGGVAWVHGRYRRYREQGRA